VLQRRRSVAVCVAAKKTLHELVACAKRRRCIRSLRIVDNLVHLMHLMHLVHRLLLDNPEYIYSSRHMFVAVSVVVSVAVSVVVSVAVSIAASVTVSVLVSFVMCVCSVCHICNVFLHCVSHCLWTRGRAWSG